MAIPYQPNYKLQPKTGFRYSAQPFVPPVQPINAPPPLGLDGSAAAAPPVMGAGQGPAYANDPFGGGDNFQPNQDQARINQAESYGYTRGTQNPLGLLQGVPILGTAMSATGAFDNLPNQTYGQPGTYDAQGNVFAEDGRAYDPLTGKAAQSYSKMTGENSWLGNTYGVGTEEGLFGPSSGYGKLRSHGESVPSSLLGSYDNSIYRQMDINPGMNRPDARLARARGAGAPIENFTNTVVQNTINAQNDEFGNIPTGPVLGTNPGDYVMNVSNPGGGMYQVSEGGQLTSPNGTAMSITDANGNKHSMVNVNATTRTRTEFIGTPFEREVPLSKELNAALDQATNPTPGTVTNWHSGNQRPTDGGTCFPEGTQISMADDTTKNIEDIQVGDKVLAFGEDSEIVEDEVTKVHVHTLNECCSDHLVKVTLSNNKEFVVTSNHPFYNPEHHGFKWIGMFEKGELVMTKDGMMYPVSSIETLDFNKQTVYNFEVKDNHTYIAEDLRVHNGSGDSPGNDNVDRSNPNEMASREKAFAESKGYGSTGRPDDTGKSMDQFARDASAGMFSSEQRAESDALGRAMGSSTPTDYDGGVSQGMDQIGPTRGDTGVGRQDYQGAPMSSEDNYFSMFSSPTATDDMTKVNDPEFGGWTGFTDTRK